MHCLQTCEVDWIGNPVGTESLKKYYDAVKVNDEEVCLRLVLKFRSFNLCDFIKTFRHRTWTVQGSGGKSYVIRHMRSAWL